MTETMIEKKNIGCILSLWFDLSLICSQKGKELLLLVGRKSSVRFSLTFVMLSSSFFSTVF